MGRVDDRWAPPRSSGSDGSSESLSRGRGRERLPSRRWASSGDERAANASHRSCSAGMGRTRSEESSNFFQKRVYAAKVGADAAGRYSSRAEDTKVAVESMLKSSKRGGGVPIKILIEQEMSKEVEQRRTSPSVIARLMGLDELPTPDPVRKNKKDSERCPLDMAPIFSKERRLEFSKEQEDFKDVYEVLETRMVRKPKHSLLSKGLSKVSGNEKLVDFVRQTFLDAKHLSTDEKLQTSKELADALDVLDSNKDVFLKILQEPNSLFREHHENLDFDPSNYQPCHVTVLKSSKYKNSENSEVCWVPRRKDDRSSQTRMDALNCLCKHECGHLSQPCLDCSASHLGRLEKLKMEGKSEKCTLPTRIVVLKPSLQKVQKADGSLSSLNSSERNQQGHRHHHEFRMSESPIMLPQFKDHHMFADDVQMSRDKRTPKANYKGTSKNGRKSGRKSSLHLLKSEDNDFACHRISHKVPWNHKILDNEVLTRTVGCCDDWSRNQASYSQSHESSVTREARKHLSERWRTSHRFPKVGSPSQASSTLGEMLALSDRDTCDMASSNAVGSSWYSTSGISSMDVWKDACLNKLARSRSLPGSSDVYSNFRRRNRTASCGNEECLIPKDVLNLTSNNLADTIDFNEEPISCTNSLNQEARENENHDDHWKSRASSPQTGSVSLSENECIVHEIAVHPHECSNDVCLSEDISMPSTSCFYDAMPLLDDITNVENAETERPNKVSDVRTAAIVQTVKHAFDIPRSTPSKETSPDNSFRAEYSSPKHHGAELSLDCNDIQQPSPISVLDPSREDEEEEVEREEKEFSPECFEKLSADLQELRLQLKLLKSESVTIEAEESEIPFDEDMGKDCIHLLEISDIPKKSFDEDDRDFSYLVDMLAGSGVHDATLDKTLTASYFPEWPVGLEIFERLEKVYDEPSMWTRAERKLFFDFTNSVLSEVVAPDKDLNPWVKHSKMAGHFGSKNLTADDIWYMLMRRRNELIGNPIGSSLDLVWRDATGVTDNLGCDLEKMLSEELLDDIVMELYSTEPLCADTLHSID